MPTTGGLPRHSGLSRCSTAAKNASRSTCRIVRTPPPATMPRLWTRAVPARLARRGAGLALGLDDDRDLGRHAREDLDRNLVRPERLERLLELDLVAIDGDATAGEGLRDLLGRDRAVQLAALADLHAHGQRGRRDAGGGDLGIGTFALALLLARGDVVLPGAIGAAGGGHGQPAGDEEVRGEAVGDGLHLARLAELVHVLRQDDLHV